MGLKSRMEKALEDDLDPLFIDLVSADDVHFQLLIVSDFFVGLSSLKRHRAVYDALGSALLEEVHALSISALTIEQWEKKES